MTIRRLLTALAAGTLVAVCGAGSATAEVRTEASARPFVPGEALVRFEPGVDPAERRGARSGAGVSFDESLALPRTQVVTFDGPVRQAIERLEAQTGVAYAQPNYRYEALAAAPNDQHFGALWGLGATPGVAVLPAWDRTRGAGQVIAVLDTGVDLTHPDLAGNLWAGPGGIHGYDFVDDDTNPDDFQFHGTHVAGTAAAIDGNGIGVAGVAPDAQIMAVRVLDGNGGGSTADIINGIVFASQQGAGVINMSLGALSDGSDTAMRNAASSAEARGTVLVAAAGNAASDNDTLPTVPCSLPNTNVLCVAAVDNQSGLATYSNYGATSVDVGAPGGDFEAGDEEILSTKPAWGAPLFAMEDFEDVTDWTASPVLGGWTQSTNSAAGTFSVHDGSPGQYANNTQVELQRTAAVSLAGQRGCRIHLLGDLDIEEPGADFFDYLFVGAVATGGQFDGMPFAGTTNGDFVELEASVSGMDGQSVRPTLAFVSDGDIVGDGAYVDNLRMMCRSSTYDGDVVAPENFEEPAATGGSYMAISGTSMAAPHAAGVAALVRAADPGAPAGQVVQAIRNGARSLPSLSGKTVTGGVVDALASIDAALALPNGQPTGPAQPVTPTPPAPTVPTRPSFATSATADARGRARIQVSGDPGTRGSIRITANLPRRASAAATKLVATSRFRIGASGRVTVRMKLTKHAVKVLRRTKRLRARARVTLTNASGLSSTRTRTVRIRLRR